ncbi:MAG: PepSY domain-containing protein, partial [Methylocystis sp.]
YSGEILQIQDPQKFTAGEKLFEWLFPVHTGEIFGEYGRPVLLLIGLLPLALFTTGLLRWRQKRRIRRTKIGT